MKLVTFQVATPLGAQERLGLLHREEVLDLNLGWAGMLAQSGDARSYQRAALELPSDMIGFFQAGAEGRQRAEQVRRSADRLRGPRGEQVSYQASAVKVLAPLPRPASIRDFLSFEGHGVRRGGPKHQDWYEVPAYYRGNPQSVIGPGETLLWPSYTSKLDYELEMGIYIGKEGRNISREKAAEYIAGYTVFNDVSVRDLPRGFYLSPNKMKDFCNAMGPCLVTPDEFEPSKARMTARINGEVWSDGPAGSMYWTWAELVEFASMEETLYPGDFLGSGTLANGCCADLDRWIKPGDVVELEITGIGVLRNPVGVPSSQRSPRIKKKS